MPFFSLPHTIRNKFIVPITIAIVLLFLVSAFAIYKYQSAKFQQAFYNQSTVFTALQAQLLANPVWELDDTQIDHMAINTFANPSVVYMKIFGDAQATEMLALFGRDPDWQMQPGLAPAVGQVPHRLVKQTPITKNLNGQNEAIGSLEIGYTNEFIQEEINRTSVLILGLGAVFLTTIIGILVVVARIVTRPIQALTEQISSWTDSRDEDRNLTSTIISALDQQTSQWDRQGEVGRLAQAFNHLIKSLGTELADRKRAESALYASERQYRQLVENANDAIFITQDGRIKFANERTALMIGYDREVLAVTPFTEFIHPEDRQMVIDRHTRRLKGEPGLPSTYTFKLIRRDASELIAELSTVLIEWQDRPATLNFIRDITAQRHMEASLRQAQKMEAIGTLAGGIAHDFNNLLLGIQGRMSLIATDLDARHPHREHIQAIEDYIRSATGLTKQLLGIGRGGKYEPKPTDLGTLMTDSAAMFGRTRKEIQIHTRIPPSPAVAEVDRQQIKQVLLNMYVNAWQAMPDGGEIFLEVSTVDLDEAFCGPHKVPPGYYARISVQDTGEGMAASVCRLIFDPFFTTKEKGRGTGLGLASAYGIIHNHQGFITVSSEIGRGTTFEVYLPVSNKAVQLEPPVKGELHKGAETILLVDDEAMILAVGRAMLEKMGYRVLVARGGAEALAVLETGVQVPDLVILDLIMPGMDGGQTFDRIRDQRPELPVILSSGYAIDGQATAIMQRGCNGFIQKPFNLAEFSAKVRSVLDTPPAGSAMKKVL